MKERHEQVSTAVETADQSAVAESMREVFLFKQEDRTPRQVSTEIFRRDQRCGEDFGITDLALGVFWMMQRF